MACSHCKGIRKGKKSNQGAPVSASQKPSPIMAANSRHPRTSTNPRPKGIVRAQMKNRDRQRLASRSSKLFIQIQGRASGSRYN